jgi:DNA polymerase (family X)
MPPKSAVSDHEPAVVRTNADIAAQLLSLAQLLSSKGENPYKIKAYRRAADTIRTLPESIDEVVRQGGDLTQIPGVGKGISGALRELVLSGSLRNLETLRSEVTPELAALSEYPRLDPKRVLRVYKKLKIDSVAALKERLQSGEVRDVFGTRMEQHLRSALTESAAMLLFDADEIVPRVEEFLVERCGAAKALAVGDFRRRVEVVHELAFLVEAHDFSGVVERFRKYGGRAELTRSTENRAEFTLSSGTLVVLERATETKWGLALVITTGSVAHLDALEAKADPLESLAKSGTRFASEQSVYRKLGLQFVPPELREGCGEVDAARAGTLPDLITQSQLARRFARAFHLQRRGTYGRADGGSSPRTRVSLPWDH